MRPRIVRHPVPGKHPGFTLLELLIALAVFSLIAVSAYSGLNAVLESEAELARQGEELAALQKTFLFISRDFRQGIARPIRDEFGDMQPALRGEAHGLTLTRAGYPNPLELARSELLRVGYSREADRLYRFWWPSLDRAQDSQPLRNLLLDKGVESFSLRYLDRDRQWHEQWPPEIITGELSRQGNKKMPLAIQVSLEITGWGRIERLFILPLALEIENEAQDLPEGEAENPPPHSEQPPPGVETGRAF